MTNFLNNQSTVSGRPRSYVNWILFDEQFKLVSSSSGFEQVGSDEEFKEHVKNNMPIDKNGYLYIYVSNTTPNINVFFDNLQVTHVRGQILEETHYYPFGLTMAGISSKAAGNMSNKEKTFQGQRFDDDLDLNWVQFKWRNHDPQIGRFIEIDPLSEDYAYNSTYAFSENKVISHVELEGLEAELAIEGAAIGAAAALEAAVVAAAPAVVVGAAVVGGIYITKEFAAKPPAIFAGSGTPLNLGGGFIPIDPNAVFQASPMSTLASTATSNSTVAATAKSATQTKSNKFGGENDTENLTSRQALRNAKDQNGIPRSQQPDKTIKPNTPEGSAANLDNRNVKQYEYTNSKGEKIIIRLDKPAKYGDDGGKGDQKPHFNAGKASKGKLKQHHYYQQ
jgi:RHS repeat-associated protein